jgi:hypothetical protein
VDIIAPDFSANERLIAFAALRRQLPISSRKVGFLEDDRGEDAQADEVP